MRKKAPVRGCGPDRSGAKESEVKCMRGLLAGLLADIKQGLVPARFWLSLYSFIVGNIALILALIHLAAKLRG